nr:RecName: Full=Temporin-1DYa [Rana dybowskii]
FIGPIISALASLFG